MGGFGFGVGRHRRKQAPAGGAIAPAISELPIVTGTAQAGQTLSCDNGSWSNAPTSYGRQWRRGGVDIAGANAALYLVGSADVGATLACAVTATNSGGSTTATSASTQFVIAAASASITGFALNGSTNPALKAAVLRVKSSSGRGRIVFKGDSTTVGQGGGSGAPNYLAGARASRVPAVLASLLSAAGIATLDNAMVGDNGMTQAGFALSSYDPRISPGSWSFENGQAFAGGNFLTNRAGSFGFTPTTDVDTFEIDIYNSNVFNLSFTIDGAAPASVSVVKSSGSPTAIVTGNGVQIPGPGSGFSRIMVTAANSALHSFAMTSSTAMSDGAVRSICAYASATRALDILVHAALGATAVNQASVGSNWSNNDALAFDAPDLTIINCGLNEMGSGGSSSAYSSALQVMIATARLSGDVLLMFPHPSGNPYNNNVAAFSNIAAGLAVSNNIAFISLYDYFGGSFTPALQARMADGIVHGTAGFNAEVGDVLKQCILAMT